MQIDLEVPQYKTAPGRPATQLRSPHRTRKTRHPTPKSSPQPEDPPPNSGRHATTGRPATQLRSPHHNRKTRHPTPEDPPQPEDPPPNSEVLTTTGRPATQLRSPHHNRKTRHPTPKSSPHDDQETVHSTLVPRPYTQASIHPDPHTIHQRQTAEALQQRHRRSLNAAQPRLSFVGRMEIFARGMNHPPTVFFHPKGPSGQAFRFDDKSYPGDGASPLRFFTCRPC
jgi:hypothetical protein